MTTPTTDVDVANDFLPITGFLLPILSTDRPSADWFRPKVVTDYNLVVLEKAMDFISDLIETSQDPSWADKVADEWRLEPKRLLVLRYLRQQMDRERESSITEENRAAIEGRGSLHKHWMAAQGLMEMGHYAAQGIPVLRHVMRQGCLLLTGNR